MLSKKMRFILISMFVFSILIFMSGCVKDQVVEPFARPTSLVRIINASPDATNPSVTLIDRDSVTAVFTVSVPYGSASGYYTVPAGNRIIRVVSGSTTKDETVTIASDRQASIIMRNSVNSDAFTMYSLFERFVYNDEAAKLTTGKSQVNFINEISGGSAVLIKNDTLTTLISSIANLANSAILLDGGKTYSFGIYKATGPVLIALKAGYALTANTRYSVVLAGISGTSGITNFSAKLYTDDK
jgi:hypothetical protein